MTNEALLDPQTQKIIKRYTTLYKLIFQYSIFFIPLILAIIWWFSLQSSDIIKTTLPEYKKFSSYTNDNGIYRAARVSDQIGPIFDGRWEIKILWWELQATGNILIGRNNLISVGGIILPNKPYIIDFWFTGSIETFNSTYPIEQLKRVLDHWILSSIPNESGSNDIVNAMFLIPENPTQVTQTNMDQILEQLKQRMFFNNSVVSTVINWPSSTSDTQTKDFITTYDLSCIQKRKLYDWFCDKNLTKFIQELPNIELDWWWKDINTIAYKINDEDKVQAFCANIMANVLRQPYPNSELDKLMWGVCSSYNSRYNTIKDFLKVQNELDSIVSEAIITSNLDINLFKLTSLRQKIALQNTNKSIDTTTVIAYLKFLDGLLHQNNLTIPQFYIDAAYYFNNAYLKIMLKWLSIGTLNPTVKSDVNTIIEQINSINKGNSSLGIRWLEKMVVNPATLQISTTTSGGLFTSIVNFEQVFKDTMQSYPELRATTLQTDEASKTARAVWTIRYLNTENQEKTIIVVSQFDYKDGKFVVSSVRTPQNPIIDTILTNYMSKNNDVSFGLIIDLIKNNSDYNKTNITMCDVLSVQKNGFINTCNTSSATITVKTISITFTISNNTITKATTTDKKRQTYLNSITATWPIKQERIGTIIDALYSLWDDKTDSGEISSIDSEKIAIIGKFKKFLWVEPNAIIFKNNKWIVAFDLKTYKFATVVAIDKNYKLSPLVIQIKEEIITIPNFSLSLIPFSQTRITQFIDDPMDYIKSIDTKAYDQIQTAIQKK